MMIDEINKRLETIISHVNDGPVKEAMNYALLAGGKRLRPLLMLTTIACYGKDYHPYLDIACAIEMVHTYSLIHDDLPCMDDDDLRRGRATCHKVYGEATAMLAGDALLTEAFHIMSNHLALDDHCKLALIAILSQAAGQEGMIYGQQQDLYYETHEANLAALKDIHAHKTGCLIQAPLMMGATIAKSEDVQTWQQIGALIGQAFQIQDDILDVIGDEKKLGKKTGVDAIHHKTTYVSILGLEKAKEAVDDYYHQTLELIYQLQINHGLAIKMMQSLVFRDA